jgi:DNA polymerase-1
MQNNPIFLIDAKYLCYRSVHALFNEPISSVQGSMFYGFMNTLKSLAKGLKITQKNVITPSNIILCWDSKHSYRKMEYRDYKKKPKLSDYQEQIFLKIREAYPKLRKWMERVGFNCAYCPGFEADDIFAGFTQQFPDQKFVIVTNDEDIYQLLSENVALWMLRKKPFLMTEENFKEKYGIEPDMWATIKGTGGCRSDNIPGIGGVGEDTALKFARGELKGTRLKKITDNLEKALYWCRFTRLPWAETKFDISLNGTDINWDEMTRFAQVYNLKSLVFKYQEYRRSFTFEKDS